MPSGLIKYSTNQSSETGTKVEEGESDQPRVNEPATGLIRGRGEDSLFDNEQVREWGEDQVFQRLKNSPEVISIMQAIVDDVMGAGFDFTYVGRADNAENPGTRAKQDAKQFWMRNQEQFAQSLMDSMAMGDGYLYKRSPDEAEAVQKVTEYIVDEYDFNYKEYAAKASHQLIDELKADEDFFRAKQLQMIPASTVRHDINEFGDIVEFTQKVSGEEFEFHPDKVIHHRFMPLNGKTYSFTPFVSLFAELDLLANAKDYNGRYFDNAAVPNKVFKLASEGPDSQNFEMVKNTLRQYRQSPNKHRDMVLTGDVEIEDLNDSTDEMNFRELAEYITRVLVMAWGVPPTRIGLPLEGSGARVTNLTHEGYFKRIMRMQRKYQALLNEELFEPEFNVRIEFRNPDIKTEIRKAERDLRELEVVKQRAAMGMIDRQAAMERLGVDPGDVPDGFDEESFVEAAQRLGRSQNTQGEAVNRDNAEEAVQSERSANPGGDDQGGGNV